MNEKEKRTWHPSRRRFARTHSIAEHHFFSSSSIFFFLIFSVLFSGLCRVVISLTSRAMRVFAGECLNLNDRATQHAYPNRLAKRQWNEKNATRSTLDCENERSMCVFCNCTRATVLRAHTPATLNETKRWSTNGRNGDHKQCYDELNKHFIFARDETCSSIPSIINVCIDIWTSTASISDGSACRCLCHCRRCWWYVHKHLNEELRKKRYTFSSLLLLLRLLLQYKVCCNNSLINNNNHAFCIHHLARHALWNVRSVPS